MADALGAQQLLAAGASGALMVFFAALYAFFFAINRLRPSRYWLLASGGSFLCLVICSMVLVQSLALSAFWQAAVVFLLLCYYIAPQLIWRLTVATHANEHAEEADGLLPPDTHSNHTPNRGVPDYD